MTSLHHFPAKARIDGCTDAAREILHPAFLNLYNPSSGHGLPLVSATTSQRPLTTCKEEKPCLTSSRLAVIFASQDVKLSQRPRPHGCAVGAPRLGTHNEEGRRELSGSSRRCRARRRAYWSVTRPTGGQAKGGPTQSSVSAAGFHDRHCRDDWYGAVLGDWTVARTRRAREHAHMLQSGRVHRLCYTAPLGRDGHTIPGRR